MSLKVIQPGALSTIQDLGRTGYMDQGMQVSGAADPYSLQVANLLVGNEPGAAALETTVLGGSFLFTEDAMIALTGAEMSPMINKEAAPMYRTCRVHAGDTLTLGFATKGCRGYLAVAGGFDIKPVMGSCSTNLKCGVGGYEGRALRAGDELILRKAAKEPPMRDLGEAAEPPWRLLDADGTLTLRVVPGPQEDYFTEKGRQTFVSGIYRLTNDSNRMACKLEGESVEFVSGGDIVSDGIVTGSVQISSNGMPIVMLADHQTTGGYAKIGTVISADIPFLAQRKPVEAVRFRYVSVEEAQKLYLQQRQYLRKLRG